MMYCLTGLALLSAESSASQLWNIEFNEVDSTDSRISEILIGSGSLLLREFVTLGYLPVTSQSKPFKCQVMAVLDPLSDNDTVSLGMAFAGEEEYGNAYVTLDIDEANTLIASMEMLEQIGVAAHADPLIPSLGHGHHALPWNATGELASGGICTGCNRGIAR